MEAFVKKINKTNKLLLNKETVRAMSEEQLSHTAGGTIALNSAVLSGYSAGPSLPGPSHEPTSAGGFYFGSY